MCYNKENVYLKIAKAIAIFLHDVVAFFLRKLCEVIPLKIPDRLWKEPL
jgi:hypothetical protein